MTKKARPVHTANCPHCRGVETLVETGDIETNTAGVDCAVWQCGNCEYREGRPIEGDA